MSATLFLAFCIIGCDLLLYFLFQWTYGEKRRGLARRANSRLHGSSSPKTQPIEFVPAKRAATPATRHPADESPRFHQVPENRQARRVEQEAYQRIVASFAPSVKHPA
jgi:hypothetical protein